MATLIYGPMVTGARGHIGGTTFSKGGPMQVAKVRAQMPRPKLASQYAARQRAATAQHQWEIMALALKANWAAYGNTVVLTNSLGMTYTLTGSQAFARYYTWALQCLGGGPTTSAPTANGLSTPGIMILSYTAHHLRMDSLFPDLGATESMMIQVFRPDHARVFNRMPQIGLIKHTNAFGANFNVVSNIDAGWSVGSLVRVHVWWRFLDADRRLGTMQKQYLDFTVV